MPHDDAHCKDCRTQPTEPGRTRCAACAAKRRARDAVLREERRTAAKCITCGKRAAKDRRYCKAHLAYYRERDAARRGAE